MNIKRYYFIVWFLIFSNLSAQSIKSYIDKYKDIAVQEMHLYNIPASITLAQGILESGHGSSLLAKEANNHFGIKCHVDWDGLTVYHDDDEQNECFRKYINVENSFRDHSLFLSQRSRYEFLFELRKTDYKGWSKGLQKAGYATSKTYSKKLINLIQTYDLSKYDKKKIKKSKLVQPAVMASNIIKEDNFIKFVLAQDGEMYDDIAERLDVWLWELLKYNESEEDRFLFEGEKVYLQPKRNRSSKSFHTVLEGETMYSISQIYGLKLKSLYKKNRMSLNTEPFIGQKISLSKKIKY